MKVRGGGGAGSVGGRVGGGVGEREGEGEAEGGEVVEGHEDEEVKRLSEALRVRDAAEVDGAEIVNTLRYVLHALLLSLSGTPVRMRRRTGPIDFIFQVCDTGTRPCMVGLRER